MSKYPVVKWLIPAGLILASTGFAIILAELVARVVVNPGDFLYAGTIEDSRLGHRIKPDSAGHDALGFRNAAVPDHVSIVAIGDSQTYGESAPRDGSWPHLLGDLLGKPVYNMGLGGYGPLHYLYLAQHQAKALKPEQLIVALYFGNDFIDAFNLAYHIPYWSGWRVGDTAEIVTPEHRLPIPDEPKKRFAGLRDWLSRNSVIYSMLRVAVLSRIAIWERDNLAKQVSPDQQAIWVDPEEDSTRTIFTPQKRLSALDDRDPKVQKGINISKRAFSSLQEVAKNQGAKLMVVLIPTKERVYCRYLEETDWNMPESYTMLCKSEERVKNEMTRFLTSQQIDFVDVTGEMEMQTFQHAQLYPRDADGHPLTRGYGVIAGSIYQAVTHGNERQSHSTAVQK